MSQIIFAIPMLGWLAISVVFTVAGEIFSKAFANNPSVLFAVTAVFLYTLGTVAWLPVILMRNRLAEVGSAWLLLTLVGAVVIGVFVFGETLNTYETVGLGLAVVALILLAF